MGSSVLHHLEIKEALRDIYRVLKPGGTIYFTEPNMLNPQIAIQKNIPWIKRKLGDSPDETAFFRWPLRRLLERTGYRDVRIDPFDFLHPKTPVALIDQVERVRAVSRERAWHLGICGLALYPCDQMSNASTVLQSQEAEDRAATLRNRARLGANKNLLFWYRELYRDQFRDFPNPQTLSILEVGSGTSPLKQFLSNVITSDVLDLDYLDLVFDCHEIDKLDAIKDNSIDVITLTNVLHHLKSPIAFLNRAASKLKSGGKVIATEPFFSVVINSHLQVSAPRTGGFPHFRAGAERSAGAAGIGEHRVTVANILPATRMAAAIERKFRCYDVFRLGPLAPYRTWLREESRANCRSHFFFIACCFQWISPSVAAFRASALLFLL